MDRRRFIRSAAGVLAAVPFAAGSIDSSAEEVVTPLWADDDSYAIWSKLIPIMRPEAHRYLVSDATTVDAMDERIYAAPSTPMTFIQKAMRGLGAGVNVPPEFLARFEEAAQGFRDRTVKPVSLERRLTLPRPYELMDSSARQEYARLNPPVCVIDPSHPWQRDRRLEEKYAEFAPPCYFSTVSFDRERTLGLVRAGANESGTFFAFGREGRDWKNLGWPTTVMLSQC